MLSKIAYQIEKHFGLIKGKRLFSRLANILEINLYMILQRAISLNSVTLSGLFVFEMSNIGVIQTSKECT